MEKIAEETDTAEEAALVLKQNINQNERGKIWAKHQAALKANPEAEAQHQQANKTQKGLGSLLWFVQNKKCQVPQCQGYLWNNRNLEKGEQWHSEAKMLKEFGKEEFAAHLQSCRIQWRSDPWTPNIFNYRDLGDQRKEVQVKRQKMHQAGPEMAAAEEGEEEFQKMWHRGVGAQMTEAEVTFSGKGRGALTKGNGKGIQVEVMDPKTSLHSVEDASLFLPHMLFSDLAHHHPEQFHTMFGLDKLNDFWLEVEKSKDDRLLGHPICLDKRQGLVKRSVQQKESTIPLFLHADGFQSRDSLLCWNWLLNQLHRCCQRGVVLDKRILHFTLLAKELVFDKKMTLDKRALSLTKGSYTSHSWQKRWSVTKR